MEARSSSPLSCKPLSFDPSTIQLYKIMKNYAKLRSEKHFLKFMKTHKDRIISWFYDEETHYYVVNLKTFVITL